MVDRPDDQDLPSPGLNVLRPRALPGVSAPAPFVALGPQSLQWMQPENVLCDYISLHGTRAHKSVHVETHRLASLYAAHPWLKRAIPNLKLFCDLAWYLSIQICMAVLTCFASSFFHDVGFLFSVPFSSLCCIQHSRL
jgi:hypothetical protein